MDTDCIRKDRTQPSSSAPFGHETDTSAKVNLLAQDALAVVIPVTAPLDV